MPLTDTAILTAKPGDKPLKLTDGNGLFLLVAPSGGKWWRFRYRFGGKEKLLALGVYPDVSLDAARERRDEARRLLAQGMDPSKAKKDAKAIEKTERLVMGSFPHVAAMPGGILEIGMGRVLVRLSEEEARFVKDILSRLLGD